MPELLDNTTALKLLNDAMPGMDWQARGRAGLSTETGLTQKAATNLMNSLKKNAGIVADYDEIEVVETKRGFVIKIGDTDCLDADVGAKLRDPMVKTKIQFDTMKAKEESGVKQDQEQSHSQGQEASLENLKPTPVVSQGTGTVRGR